MNNFKERSIHQRLLVASYILGALSSLLRTLAAIGSTMERNDLQYPSVNSQPPTTEKGADTTKRYFDQ